MYPNTLLVQRPQVSGMWVHMFVCLCVHASNSISETLELSLYWITGIMLISETLDLYWITGIMLI